MTMMAENESSAPVTSTAFDIPDDELQRCHSTLGYFNTIPWCSAILNAPRTTRLHQLKRGGPRGDSFWTKTLRKPDVVRGAIIAVPSDLALEYPRVKSSITLYSFGSDVGSHPDICHGGFTNILFDEAMSLLVAYIEDVEAQENKAFVRRTFSTLKIEVSYRKPVPAPGVVMVRSSIDLIQGRKRSVVATLEDEKGHVLCEAKGLFLLVDAGIRQGARYAKL